MWEWIKNNWIGEVIALLTGIVGYLLKKANSNRINRKKSDELNRSGLRALLRGEMIKTYNHYIVEEYCPIYELENIDEMYRSYKGLMGNGCIDELVEKLRTLPTEKPKNKEAK